jgi:prepilin-type N-terminal cleavage/methylation domain-containing protein
MKSILRGRKSEEGFTLVELLIVIVILGIIAAVVVFATQGLQDRGQLSACRTDAKVLRTANEANLSENGRYDDEATLVTNELLTEVSGLHTMTTVDAAGTDYTIAAAGDCVGEAYTP